MIEILAKDDGEGTELSIHITGKTLEIAYEAYHIMEQLPEQLQEASSLAYLLFMVLKNDMADTKIEELIDKFSNDENREEEQDDKRN